MTADAGRPNWKTTRRGFLLAGGCALVALVLGRRWSLPAGEARPRRADNLSERTGAFGVELRPTPVDAAGPVYRLNRSAALVWRGVDGRRGVAEIAALVATAYGVSPAAARADTHECLAALAAQGLVFGVPAAGGGTRS
jgi:hypothetical protein